MIDVRQCKCGTRVWINKKKSSTIWQNSKKQKSYESNKKSTQKWVKSFGFPRYLLILQQEICVICHNAIEGRRKSTLFIAPNTIHPITSVPRYCRDKLVLLHPAKYN